MARCQRQCRPKKYTSSARCWGIRDSLLGPEGNPSMHSIEEKHRGRSPSHKDPNALVGCMRVELFQRSSVLASSRAETHVANRRSEL